MMMRPNQIMKALKPGSHPGSSRRTGTGRLAALSLALLAGLVAGPAAAQDYSKILGALDKLKPSITGRGAVTGAFVGGAFAPAQLRHLPAHPLGNRLAGESDSRTWPFYVSAAQLGKPAVFRLSYMNAVSVMPESSELALYINGERIHQMPILSSVEPSQTDIVIPAELLALGYNAITVAATQRHRVDCSPNATFELWTDIIESGTGFVTSDLGYNIASLADLPSVILSADGKVRIRALLPDKPTDVQLRNFYDFAQMIALAGDFKSPVVEIGESFGPGIDMFVGSRAELMARAPDLADELVGPGPFYIVSNQDTGTLFLALIIEGEITPDSLRRAVPIAEVQGTPLGIQTLATFSPARVYEGRRTTLRALGFQDEEFKGRLYRRSFKVALSPDFYPADYDVVRLSLSAAYMPGLSRKSGITVRVNGVTNTSIVLGNANGDVFTNKGIELALSAFKAGQNTIEIEASLARATDTSECPLGTVANEPARFMLSPESAILMPEIAHFGLLPNLGNALRSGFPHIGTSDLGETAVFLGNREPGTLSAAGSVIAHLASVAGRPMNFVVRTGFPRGDETNAIILGPLNELAGGVVENLEFVDVGKTRVAWSKSDLLQPGDGEAPVEVDASPTGAVGDIPELAAPADAAAAASRDLESFRAKWTGERNESAQYPTLHKAQEWLTNMLADVGVSQSANDLPARLNGETSELIVTQSLAPSGRGAWTVFTARDANSLATQMERFLRPEPVSQIEGQAVGFDAKTADLVNAGIAASGSGVLGAKSFTNLRLVFAGWLSNNPLIYLVMIVSAIGLAGVAANRFLKTSGRQDGHMTGTGSHG